MRSPEELARVLHLHHTSGIGAHSGWNSTFDKMRREYFWRNMNLDIKHYVCITLSILFPIVTVDGVSTD